MKKNLIIGFKSTVFALLITGSSFAQSGDVALNNPIVAGKENADVSLRVAKSFIKNFNADEKVNWKKTKDECIAEFRSGDRLAIAWFSHAGKLNAANFYGAEKDLPSNEQLLVKSHYPDYAISATTEIHRNYQVGWMITLDNCNYIKKVKIVNGVLEEVEQFRKGQ